MSKNTRWALAIVGVLIVIVAGVVIGTGRENTDATPAQEHSGDVLTPTGEAGATGDGATGTGATGTAGSDQGHGEDGQGEHESGGAAPQPSGSGDDSGGAAPRAETGGSMAEPNVVSPILVEGKQVTVKAKKGDTVMIRARSSKPATLHLHGYDKTIELTPNRVGRMRVNAKIDGEFEIAFHFHGSEVGIGKLRVSP